MPKQVDHHQRRTLIADALIRLAADRGLEAVSLRHVAAEAGVSAGMVQHYFRTKEEMMAFTLAVISERTSARLEVETDSLGPSPTPHALIRSLLLGLLPLDEERLVEGRVTLAFLAYVAVHPSVAPLQHIAQPMRAFIADQLRQAAAPDLDADHEAAVLHALVEGLGLQVISGHVTPAFAADVLETRLADLFGTERA